MPPCGLVTASGGARSLTSCHGSPERSRGPTKQCRCLSRFAPREGRRWRQWQRKPRRQPCLAQGGRRGVVRVRYGNPACHATGPLRVASCRSALRSTLRRTQKSAHKLRNRSARACGIRGSEANCANAEVGAAKCCQPLISGDLAGSLATRHAEGPRDQRLEGPIRCELTVLATEVEEKWSRREVFFRRIRLRRSQALTVARGGGGDSRLTAPLDGDFVGHEAGLTSENQDTRVLCGPRDDERRSR